MTLALLVFLLLAYFFISNLKIKNPRIRFVVVATFVMILISGLRHEAVGNDTLATMLRFEEAADTEWKEIFTDFWGKYFHPSDYLGKDPAELVFYKSLSYLTDNPRVFLFVVATIVLCSLGFFIYESSQSLRAVFFSYVFFITLSYNYLPNSSFRQSMAFALLLPSFIALKKKNDLLFFFLVFLASFFHKSALIAIVIYPLLYIKRATLMYWLSIIPFVFVFFYYKYVGAFLEGFSDVYDDYVVSTYYNQHSQPIMVILMILGLFIYIGFAFNHENTQKGNRLFIYGSALTLILVPLVRLDPSVLRLISYFAVLMAIQVGNSSLTSATMRSLYWVIVLIFVAKAAIKPDDGYRFMWQEKKLHERYLSYVFPKKEPTDTSRYSLVLDSNSHFLS